MKTKIKKLMLTIVLVLSAVVLSPAQTDYASTKRVLEGDNPQISITELAVNTRPYENEDIQRTRILAKNAITFPESYQNLSIVRNDTNILIVGREIQVIEPGHLSFKFTYTENGVSYTCDILGDVNYYGELKYQGRTNLSVNPIVVTNQNKNDHLSIPAALSSVEWMLYRNVFEADKETINYDQLAECQNTTFSRKNVISFNELLTLKSDQIFDGKLKLLLLFEDRSSNALSNGVPGGTSVQAITLVDARTYNLSLSQEGQGTVSVSKSQLKARESATLTAQAAQGWRFSHWEENAQNLGTTNPLTVTMGTQDRSIKAVFTEIPKVRVTLQILDTNGQKLADPQYQDVTSGGSVTFQVPSLANVNFKGWKRNGQIVETGNTYTLSNVTQNETIQAVFEVPVQSVTVTPASITAKVGEGPVQLTATVLPSNATSRTVTWISKNEQVVTVDSTGKVTIIGAGETTIEAQAGEKTFTVQVKIEAQPQQPQESDFPPYTVNLQTFKVNQTVDASKVVWENFPQGLDKTAIKYSLRDFNGVDISNNKQIFEVNGQNLTFKKIGSYSLIATLRDNQNNEIRIDFTIQVNE